jgi:hypothetical protein
MDAWVIILIVLIFVIIYAMYMITTTSSLIKAMSPLNAAVTIKATDEDKIMIPSPTSQNYYYEAWIYLTAATNISSNYPAEGVSLNENSLSRILGRLNGNKADVGLYVFQKDSKKYTLCVLAGKTGGSTAKPYFVTEDLPTHKWVYLAMNVNGKLVEVYVNGKLLRTIYLETSESRSATDSINIGHSTLGGYITRAIRKPDNIDAQKVWDNYLVGNGQYGGAMYGMLDYINSYAFKMNITSNGKVQREFTAQIAGTETN